MLPAGAAPARRARQRHSIRSMPAGANRAMRRHEPFGQPDLAAALALPRALRAAEPPDRRPSAGGGDHHAGRRPAPLPPRPVARPAAATRARGGARTRPPRSTCCRPGSCRWSRAGRTARHDGGPDRARPGRGVLGNRPDARGGRRHVRACLRWRPPSAARRRATTLPSDRGCPARRARRVLARSLSREPYRQHFELLGLCTAGRTAPAFGFEAAALIEQVGFQVALATAVCARVGSASRSPISIVPVPDPARRTWSASRCGHATRRR